MGARIALRRTLIKQFFTHERITTTRAKAEAIRGDAERMITLARKTAEAPAVAKVNARRLIAARLGGGDDVVRKLFDDIAPRFATRPGGYTRMLKLGPRFGDSAEMVMLELVEE
jgi:large subunit ribosomal protein L17